MGRRRWRGLGRDRCGGRFWLSLILILVLLASALREGILRAGANGGGFFPVRAIWVTQYDQADWLVEDGRPRAPEAVRASVRQALDVIVGYGLNTVFLQVRPFGDSFYPSAVYPPSRLAVGEYGGDFLYDPLAIWVEEAAAVGVALHAWINPFRAMREDELQQVSRDYAIRRWREDPALCGRRIVEVEGRWYLNPADAEARALILAGAAELLSNYSLAGIHLDDYFYPTVDPSFDAAAYAEGGAGRSLGDFRRAQVDGLVRELHALCAEAGVLFGISPAGDPDACYRRLYADVFRWGSESGYVDYLCPQLYFGFEHETHGFAQLCARWQSLATAVPLLVGLTFHKVGAPDPAAGSGAAEWLTHRDILARSALHASTLPSVHGLSLFSYRYLLDPATSAEREALGSALGKPS